jgi:hypothetical protein
MNILFMQSNNIPKEEPKMIDDWLAEHGDPNIFKKVEKQLELEEAAENDFNILQEENPIVPDNHIWPFKLGYLKGAKWQADKMYTEEDMSEAHFQGWVTRERFDDLSPDIIYPQGLDYEEKREYAFNLWLDKYKKK